jgi:pSer/pThr/pTyr-binding forkhead associated (FHA) protein
MAKIILTKDGKMLQEITLAKERITIGRRPHNDVVIEDTAISGEHAMILFGISEAILEDLNSTNGTKVNAQPIKKHFLQNQDVIELTAYSLLYVTEEPACDESFDLPGKSTVNEVR